MRTFRPARLSKIFSPPVFSKMSGSKPVCLAAQFSRQRSGTCIYCHAASQISAKKQTRSQTPTHWSDKSKIPTRDSQASQSFLASRKSQPPASAGPTHSIRKGFYYPVHQRMRGKRNQSAHRRSRRNFCQTPQYGAASASGPPPHVTSRNQQETLKKLRPRESISDGSNASAPKCNSANSAHRLTLP